MEDKGSSKVVKEDDKVASSRSHVDDPVSLDLSKFIPELKTGQRRSVVLFETLKQVQEKLQKKEEECQVLTKEQTLVGEEVQDFTASLFEEANKMIQEAHRKRVTSEKQLVDAQSKIEVLQAEVMALKKIIMTSTSNAPVLPTNPQINRVTSFIKGHKRSTSHHNFVKTDEPPKEDEMKCPRFDLFKVWKDEPKLDESSCFVKDLTDNDILPCLSFPNKQLVRKVQEGIFLNTLAIEPLNKLACKKSCSLLEKEVFCEFAIKFENSPDMFIISKPARDRITSVCDLISYLRYITLGLVKANDSQVFQEIKQRLKKMCLTRLGLDG